MEVQAGLQGQEAYMTLEQYHVFWWVSLPVVLFGVVLCLKDVRQRFSGKGERSKWYALLLFLGSIAYPYYFLSMRLSQGRIALRLQQTANVGVSRLMTKCTHSCYALPHENLQLES